MTEPQPSAPLRAPHPTDAADTAPDPHRFRALAVILLAQLVVVLDASIVTVAVPSAQDSLGLSVGDRSWVFTAYTLTFGGLLLLGGRVADRLGRKRVFEVGLVGFAAASVLGGVAQDAGTLFAARALQGAFAAALAPAALSLLQVTFTDARERARALGLYGAIAGGAMSVGLIAGGMLTEWASWRWTLLVNVPIALLALLGSRLVVRESRAEGESRYDVTGAVLVTAGLVALVYGFSRAGSDGWAAAPTLGLLAVGVVLLAAFVVVEARTAQPLLPLRLLADRNRAGALVTMVLTVGGLFSTFILLTFYLQGVLGYSALETGVAYLPYSVGTFVGAATAGSLISRLGPLPLMVTGMALGAAGLVLFARVEVDSGFASHVLPAEVVTSIGLGLALVPLTSTALLGVAAADAGVASALVQTTQQIGSSLGIAVMNTIAASAAAARLSGSGAAPAAAAVHGYVTAFLVGAVLLAVSALLALALVRARREDVPGAAGDASVDEALVDLAEGI